MAKERQALTWEGNNEEVRRLFTLTPDDLYFLRPLRADSQRLYRALVLLWARVERVLLSETTSIPEGVITQVSKQLGLSPSLLEQQRNHPSMRAIAASLSDQDMADLAAYYGGAEPKTATK